MMCAKCLVQNGSFIVRVGNLSFEKLNPMYEKPLPQHTHAHVNHILVLKSHSVAFIDSSVSGETVAVSMVSDQMKQASHYKSACAAFN